MNGVEEEVKRVSRQQASTLFLRRLPASNRPGGLLEEKVKQRIDNLICKRKVAPIKMTAANLELHVTFFGVRQPETIFDNFYIKINWKKSIGQFQSQLCS